MDCTFKTDNGIFNYRVGAIITNGRKILMTTNPKVGYFYSVGGRVKLGETLENAILRELKEETGIDCKIERLAVIHENFFNDDDGMPVHEVSVFFKIQPSENICKIENGHKTLFGSEGEYLEWIDIDNDKRQIYPEFFRTLDFENLKDILHIVEK